MIFINLSTCNSIPLEIWHLFRNFGPGTCKHVTSVKCIFSQKINIFMLMSHKQVASLLQKGHYYAVFILILSFCSLLISWNWFVSMPALKHWLHMADGRYLLHAHWCTQELHTFLVLNAWSVFLTPFTEGSYMYLSKF